MKQVTQIVIAAFNEGKAKKVGNTHTDGKSLFLHGNKIAEHRDDGLYISNAGWFSKTTKERLNGLPDLYISQKKYKWYIHRSTEQDSSVEWDGSWVRVNTNTPPQVDQSKVGKSYDLSTHWEGVGYRGATVYNYAVASANDTGLWDDSPCPSRISQHEVGVVYEALKKAGIPSRILTSETSNVFCIKHSVVVPPFYFEKAKEVVDEFLATNETRLIYKP